MHLDLALAGLLGGFVVGLTGMGGGALMTPMLVLIFHIDALAAVSSDLVVSLVMKPVGARVHMKRGTVNRPLVGWLMVGSIPSAFLGVLVIKAIGNRAEDTVKTLLGAALLVASACIVAKMVLQRRVVAREKALVGAGGEVPVRPPVVVKPIPTILVGIFGGLIVGMTSVGSGSLIIVLIMLLYPRLTSAELVGTDLVQAIPLVASAALGHLLFGDVKFGLTASLIVGGVPGIWVGAHVSSSAPDHVIRPVLFVVLAATGAKLLGII